MEKCKICGKSPVIKDSIEKVTPGNNYDLVAYYMYASCPDGHRELQSVSYGRTNVKCANAMDLKTTEPDTTKSPARFGT